VRYYYSDIDAEAQAAAAAVAQRLSAARPDLLPPSAITDMFNPPQDVYQVTASALLDLHPLNTSSHWFIAGGFECQDLSSAGSCRGLKGEHSKSYWALLRILGEMQQSIPQQLAWLVENTAFQYNFRSGEVATDHFRTVCKALGKPLVLDAAQVGSRARRLRNYWGNLAPLEALLEQKKAYTRPPNILAQDIMGPGRQCSTVTVADCNPYYVANVVGSARYTLPTLMAAQQSWAFHPHKSGAVWDTTQQRWSQPCPEEREMALGYPPGVTAAADLSPSARHKLTGRCIDHNAARWILLNSRAITKLCPVGYAPGNVPVPATSYTAAVGSEYSRADTAPSWR
jgi:hypothetical protein